MTLLDKKKQISDFLGFQNTDCTKIKIASLEGGKDDEWSHAESVKDVLEEYGNITYFEPTMKNGYGYTSGGLEHDNFFEFIDTCIENKVNIITCSKDCPISRERANYVKKAYDAGIIIMVAAGNKGEEIGEHETGDLRNSPYVVTVGSYYLDSDGKMRWGGHNYGKVDLLMPTYVPLDLDDNGKLESSLHGTSFATPLGDLVLAECILLNPKIDSKTVKKFIQEFGQTFKRKGLEYKYLTLKDKENIIKYGEEENMVKTYTDSVQISKHFNSKEFICPDCGIMKTDTKIVAIMEDMFKEMPIDRIIVTSGFRCNGYEMTLKGGVFNGYHTQGRAVDINVYKNKTERYSSKEICLALEKLGWNHGIGIISDTAVHIDSRDNKYWFDERNGNKSIGDSFKEYFSEKSNREKVKERFEFDEQVTMKFLDKHPYVEALYDKLANTK